VTKQEIKQINLFPKQGEALRYLNDKTTNEILYGGGARGGKSWLGCLWVAMSMLSKPGSAFIIIRKDHRRLTDTTLITFNKVLKEYEIKNQFHFDAQKSTITTKNGSICFFREGKYYPQDPEYDRFGSYDLTGAFIDEAQEVKVKLIDVLRGRFSLLSGDGWSSVPKMFLSCNPSKGFIYSDFYKPWKDGTLPVEKIFIPALATDNPHVSKEYINNLKRSSKITVERLLYGNFEYDDDPTQLINYDSILSLYNNDHIDEDLKRRFITADIAMQGSDLFVLMVWHGFVLVHFETMPKSGGKEVVDLINKLRRKYIIPEKNVIYDADGVGSFIGGRGGYLPLAKSFINNSKPIEIRKGKENYENLKTQCEYKLADRINNDGYFLKAIKDLTIQERINQELEQIKTRDADKDGKLKTTRKEDRKEVLGRSPDFSDCFMMREYVELKPTTRKGVKRRN
jgi:phage terminase large subunit